MLSLPPSLPLLLLVDGAISDGRACMWEYVITVTPRQRDVAHCVRGRGDGGGEKEAGGGSGG